MSGKNFALGSFLDWRHPLKYQPTGPADPGWDTRAADGTAVIRMGDYLTRTWVQVGGALSLQGTVVPDSIKILTRVTSPYGQDVTFQITDTSGKVHQGRGTVLYPLRPNVPGLITELVYTS